MSEPTPIHAPCPTCRCMTCICDDTCTTCGQARREHPNNGCLALANRRRMTLKAEFEAAIRERDEARAALAARDEAHADCQRSLFDAGARLDRCDRERDEAVDAAHWLSTQKNDLALALDEVRAVLAPLLEHPARDDGELDTCVFCWARAEVEHELTHAPGCAVYRADALLGREAT